MSQHNFRARPLTAATFAEVESGEGAGVLQGSVRRRERLHVRVRRQRRHDDAQAAGREVSRVAAVDRIATETFRDNGGAPPKGVVEKRRAQGRRAQSEHDDRVHRRVSRTRRRTRFAIRALVELFQIKLNETLREQLGGTYSPSVGGGCCRVPRQEYTIQVQFNSSPDNVEKLTKSVFALIDTLKTKRPDAGRRRQGARRKSLRAREVELKQNAYWLGNIIGARAGGRRHRRAARRRTTR